MRSLRRFGGIMVLVLSVVGIIGCASGIIGVWVFYPGVSEKVQTTSDRLDKGLERLSAANQNVRSAIERARAEVATVRKESADLGGGGDKGRRASRALRTVIQQMAAPNIDALGGRLDALSDAAAAISSVLESFQELPTGPRVRVEPDLLRRRADETQQLSASLRRLGATLGDGENETSSRGAAAAASEVDQVLQKCQMAVDSWQSDLDAGRADLARVSTRMPSWLRYLAITMTVLFVWAGAGQISLLGRAREWLKRAGTERTTRRP
jgi:methyl-accepting chemotaxis protein